MVSVKFWCLRALNDLGFETDAGPMTRCLRWWLVGLAGVLTSYSLLAQTPNSEALNSLSQFLKQTQSGRAQFTQVVTSPAKGDQAPRRKTSSGTFEFLRPQQFRFAYQKPFVQTMVSDGQSLWLYDADLNQVTVRKQSLALGQTPAAFIASTGDLKVLQAEFNLAAEPDTEGLQWVKATPKQSDGAVQTIRVGLKVQGPAPPVLTVLEIVDGMGQTSRFTFQNFEVNVKLATETFQFKTPSGAQVLRP